MAIADKEELLKVLDENGNFTGEYKNRSEVHENKLYRIVFDLLEKIINN